MKFDIILIYIDCKSKSYRLVMMLWLLMDEPIAITALFGSKYSSCSFHLIRGVIVALPG